MSQNVKAETYQAIVDFVFQTSDLVGQDIDVFGRVVRLDAIEEQTIALESRTGTVERTSAVTSPVAWLSLLAIASASFSLMVQFGVLKLRRRGQG